MGKRNYRCENLNETGRQSLVGRLETRCPVKVVGFRSIGINDIIPIYIHNNRIGCGYPLTDYGPQTVTMYISNVRFVVPILVSNMRESCTILGTRKFLLVTNGLLV